MRIYQTKLQKSATLFPDKIEFSKIANVRGAFTSSKDIKNNTLMMKGQEGENILLNYIEDYGNQKWLGIPNLWMNKNGNFECDLILITSHKIYSFEVKNYSGTFCYQENGCSINDVPIDTNCIEQTRRAMIKLQNIFHENKLTIELEMVNVFSNADCEILINSSINHTHIVPRYQLANFITSIVKEEQKYHGKLMNVEELLPIFNQYELEYDPFLQRPFGKENMDAIKKGIHCEKCENYAVNFKKFEVRCACSHIESKEKAVLRTICEYGVLTYDSDFILSDINRFLDEQVSKSFLLKILRKYFTLDSNSSRSRYQNLRLPYAKLEKHFLSRGL